MKTNFFIEQAYLIFRRISATTVTTVLFAAFLFGLGLCIKYHKQIFAFKKNYKQKILDQENERQKRELERKVTFENQENIIALQKSMIGLQNSFNSLQESQIRMEKDNSEHWEVSKNIRGGFAKDIKTLTEGVSHITNQIDKIERDKAKEMEEKRSTKRAEIKHTIGTLYRECHQKNEWDYMQEDTLRDLIKEYEANGGDNSFVHDKVIPESYTWELITKEMYDEMDKSKNK